MKNKIIVYRIYHLLFILKIVFLIISSIGILVYFSPLFEMFTRQIHYNDVKSIPLSLKYFAWENISILSIIFLPTFLVTILLFIIEKKYYKANKNIILYWKYKKTSK